MIPTFGGKKVQPAFQVKVAAAVALPGKNSSTAASPLVVRFPNPLALPKASEAGNLTPPFASLNAAATPAVLSSLAPAAAAGSSEAGSSKAPPAAAALAPTSTLPLAALPPQGDEAGECNSDEDFEKENILIDPKTKKPPTKSKKLKVKKDPDAPKKPLTSYVFFCKQVCSTSSVHQSSILCCPGATECDE